MQFLFDHEDEYGENAFLSGTCDRIQLRNTSTRPPNLEQGVAPAECRTDYAVYSPRFNRTRMDVSAAGIPKPQFCTSDPNGQCGHFISRSGDKAYQSVRFALYKVALFFTRLHAIYSIPSSSKICGILITDSITRELAAHCF